MLCIKIFDDPDKPTVEIKKEKLKKGKKSIYKFNYKNPEIFVTIISGFLFTKSDKNGMISIVTSLVKKI